MTCTWNVVVSPTSFRPVFGLIINGRRPGIEITVHDIYDLATVENESMMLLLDPKYELTDLEIAESYTELRKKFSSFHKRT